MKLHVHRSLEGAMCILYKTEILLSCTLCSQSRLTTLFVFEKSIRQLKPIFIVFYSLLQSAICCTNFEPGSGERLVLLYRNFLFIIQYIHTCTVIFNQQKKKPGSMTFQNFSLPFYTCQSARRITRCTSGCTYWLPFFGGVLVNRTMFQVYAGLQCRECTFKLVWIQQSLYAVG